MCASGVFCALCILFDVARRVDVVYFVDLVYFVYVDGFFCSMCVHLVCFVYCVLCIVLPVLLFFCMLHVLMVSSVQCMCIWRALLSVYYIICCPSCWFGFFCIY